MQERVRSNLMWIISSFLYPVIVIAVFIYIILSIVEIIGRGTDKKRRITAALLPHIVLVFLEAV
jgi:hypothetical protein